MNKILLAAITLTSAMPMHAQMTPVGNWKTIDDRTQKPRSVVKISETAETLTGVILERLDDGAKPSDVCDKCPDDRKNRSLSGLEIIRGVGLKSNDAGRWEGGRILDPESGKEYRLQLTPIEGGRKLEVRGFLGTPWVGRTQVWVRAE